MKTGVTPLFGFPKKSLSLGIFFSLLLFSGNMLLTAQITLTNNDVVGPGNSFLMATDLSPDASIVAGTPGSGKQWDFSALKITTEDSIHFVDPKTLPKYNDFQDATLGYYFENANDSTWAFVRSSSTELEVLGAAGIDESTGDTIPVRLEFPLLTFPSSLGTTFTDHFLTFTFSDTLNVDPDGPGPHAKVDSIRFTNTTRINSEMDAEGTLITPRDTLNTLRQWVQRIFIDSSFMYTNGSWKLFSPTMSGMFLRDSVSADTTLAYRWWTKIIGFPLVEFGVDNEHGRASEQAVWLDVNDQPSSVGIAPSLTTNRALIYPNPSTGNIVIQLSNKPAYNADTRLIIRDLNGKNVAAHPINRQQQSIQVDLPAGVYLCQLLQGTEHIAQQRLVIQK
jgi:hypothetical protein